MNIHAFVKDRTNIALTLADYTMVPFWSRQLLLFSSV